MSDAQDPKSEPTTRIAGRYLVEATIGSGGMGTVVRVFDELNNKRVALKRLLRDASDRDDAATSVPLQREYHTLKQLAHPNIIEALDFGIDESGPYYTMELLEGDDLRELAPVDWPRACSLLRDVASALALLHSRRLLHRDVSPRNVRCDRHGVPKLIDFGALATIGVSMEVVGTPPFIPREALHGQALDQRADIYGLGALAYWLLTGRHAYPVSTLVALEAAWRRTPERPSTLVPEIPAALDELVLSMLKIDALARPGSAVEVITRLEVIAQLPPLSVEETAQAYLTHPTMTGRAPELGVLRQRVRRTLQGRGGAVMIEAASGLGRTRLLQESKLDATLEGALVMRAQARASGTEAYGVVRALVQDMLDSTPDEITLAAQAHLPILGHLFPAIHARLGGGALPPLPHEPSELRARIQHTLRTWLTEVSLIRPLVIAVDDVHRCDEPSAALIASLAVEAGAGPLLILTTLRAGGEIEAAAPVRALREHSTRMVLNPLSQMAIEHLVRSLFGAAPHMRRVGDWIHEMSAGNPLRAMELVRDLVERGVIRHENGLWLLPADLSREAAPHSLAAAFAARVENLSEHARHVGEILAVSGERLPIEMFVRVAGGDRGRTFRALDELVMGQVLVGSSATYDFAQDGMREALLRALPQARKRAIHISLGEALLSRGVDRASRKVQAGFHLLQGGAELRGAELLVEAILALGRSSGAFDLGPTFVSALEAALAAFEKAGRSPAERVILQIALARCAYLHDRRLLHHGLAAIEQLRIDSGLADAERLDPHMPASERWQMGVLAAKARYEQARPVDRGLPPAIAVPQLITAVFAVTGVLVVCLDSVGVAKLCDGIKIWSELDADHPGKAAHWILSTALDQLRGRDLHAKAQRQQLRTYLQNTELFKRLPQEVILHLRAVSLHGVGMVEALEGHHALERAEELEALDARAHAGAAMQIRMLKHLHDGDTARAEEYRERMEALALEGGTSWHVEMLLPVYLAIAYSVSGDMLGLRRAIEQLVPVAQELPGYAPYLWLARGAYHRERGELTEAKAALVRAIELAPAGEHACWSKAIACYVQTLVVCREHDRARQQAEEALVRCEQVAIMPQRLRWAMTPWIALAQARVGDTVAAARRLDTTIAEAQQADAAGVVLGRLHEARARVALLSADRAMFHEQLAAVARYFAATRDPMLVASHARLYEEGMRSGATQPPRTPSGAPSAPPPGPVEETRDLRAAVRQALASATRPRERAERALQILLENVGLKHGYLFLWSNDAMRLAAPLHGEEPPEDLQHESTQLVSEAISGSRRESRPPRTSTSWTSARGETFRLLMLATMVEGRRAIVAVLALSMRDAVFSPPSNLLLRAVSETLLASGDVQPAFAEDLLPR